MYKRNGEIPRKSAVESLPPEIQGNAQKSFVPEPSEQPSTKEPDRSNSILYRSMNEYGQVVEKWLKMTPQEKNNDQSSKSDRNETRQPEEIFYEKLTSDRQHIYDQLPLEYQHDPALQKVLIRGSEKKENVEAINRAKYMLKNYEDIGKKLELEIDYLKKEYNSMFEKNGERSRKALKEISASDILRAYQSSQKDSANLKIDQSKTKFVEATIEVYEKWHYASEGVKDYKAQLSRHKRHLFTSEIDYTSSKSALSTELRGVLSKAKARAKGSAEHVEKKQADRIKPQVKQELRATGERLRAGIAEAKQLLLKHANDK